jgi:dihydroneopterin aldolase
VTDRIEILGITGWGHHGVLESERQNGQEFRIDIALGVDIAPAAANDDLAQTIDYSVVAQSAHAIVVGEPFDLIETLAQRIADACLEMPGLAYVEVAVHKPSAPIPVPFDDVIVRIRREKT